MKRSRRIGVIESMAEREEREERRLMAQSQQSLELALGRLEELRAYRQSYAAEERPKSGTTALQWQDYHRFMQRLEHAVSAQEQIVAEGQSQREAHQKRWMAKRQRLESLSRIVERFQKQEADDEQRRQQKQQDELALRGGYSIHD